MRAGAWPVRVEAAAERGCDYSYKAASGVLIKGKKEEGAEGAPPENLGGRSGEPGPRPDPSSAPPK